MKQILQSLLFMMALLTPVLLQAQEYETFRKSAYKQLEKGNCEKARMNYETWQANSGESDTELEARIKECCEKQSQQQTQLQQQTPTLSLTGVINGHEYVDLGLPSGLKWATCNVGASSQEQYGNHFAWGKQVPKVTMTIKTPLPTTRVCLISGQTAL